MTAEITPIDPGYRDLLEKINSGTTVITGNVRLSSYLTRLYDKWKFDNGAKAWPTVDILSWNAWQKRTFHECYSDDPNRNHHTLINDVQEQIIWQRIIRASEDDTGLLQLAETARHASSSYQLLKQWGITLKPGKQYYNEDVRAFASWARQFQIELQKKSWVAATDLTSILVDMLEGRQICLPEHIILTGFDEFTSQQKQLIQLIQAQQCKVEWLACKSRNESVQCLQASHTREEIDMAARWARAILEENKNAKIGIVVPELRELRDIISLSFLNVLKPDNISLAASRNSMPVNISLGKTLSQYPYIETALCILAMEHMMDIEKVSIIICSPYVQGWSDEKFRRSQLDRNIRQTGSLMVKLDYITRLAQEQGKVYECPDFSQQLDGFIQLLKTLPEKARPSAWVKRYSDLLSVFGYSNGRTLSSEEYQVAQAWTELLYEMTTLDNTCGQISHHAMLGHLSRCANERLFQAKSQDAPVQILGVMEATGFEFDHLWVLGLHDGVWPPAPRPDPFIPTLLQRKYDLPHSSASREFKIISKITDRLVGSAREVIISYPEMNATEVLRPSPLLQDYPHTSIDHLKQWGSPLWRKLIFESSLIETKNDDIAPPVENEIIKGGSQIVKLQSQCPFRAFAEIRLDARSVDTAKLGQSMAERGSILHQILELIWKDLRSQQKLKEMSEQELNTLIDDKIKIVQDNHELHSPAEMPKHFKEVERSRLFQLISNWIEKEKLRDEFDVLATEKNVLLDIDGLSINLKLDRLDELAQGQKVVIDYKTGDVSPSQWFGKRPEDPQLPLYSLAISTGLEALVFARLKTGMSGFKGVASDKNMLPGVKSFDQLQQSRQFESWSALMDEWRATVKSLANEFRLGVAKVDPQKYPASCNYCSLGQFCRINESRSIIESLVEVADE